VGDGPIRGVRTKDEISRPGGTGTSRGEYLANLRIENGEMMVRRVRRAGMVQ